MEDEGRKHTEDCRLSEQERLIQPPSSSTHRGSPVPWSEGPAPTVEVFCLSGRDTSSQGPSSLRRWPLVTPVSTLRASAMPAFIPHILVTAVITGSPASKRCEEMGGAGGLKKPRLQCEVQSGPKMSLRPHPLSPSLRPLPLCWDGLVNGWVIICEQGKALTRG